MQKTNFPKRIGFQTQVYRELLMRSSAKGKVNEFCISTIKINK